MKTIAFALASFLVLSACTAEPAPAPSGPACAASLAGTSWDLTLTRKGKRDGTTCDAIGDSYTSALTIGAKAGTWTQAEEDGDSIPFSIKPESALPAPRCALSVSRIDRADGKPTVETVHLVEIDDSGILSGSTLIAITPAGVAATAENVECSVTLTLSATPR